MICPGGVPPTRDLSSLLSVTVSAAKLASCTGDTAAANRVGGMLVAVSGLGFKHRSWI